MIDDTRNWWKARNSAGNIGYVPHTILTPHNFEINGNYSNRDTDSVTSSQLENGMYEKIFFFYEIKEMLSPKAKSIVSC